mmetsp:Transcript_21734/g.46967  ORF Transcript_21734/g.46967 Transcript_21734/m.46967 type:complete len:788 (-) Transcript_21734:43-2406(-)
MAASIKMDELLVSWLGSDNVYDNVVTLIEEKRTEEDEQEVTTGATAAAAAGAGAGAGAGASPEDDETEKGAANDGSGGGGDASSMGNESPRGVVIPPFYVPRCPPAPPSPSSSSSTGDAERQQKQHQQKKQVQYHRRPRSGSFADDQTWEGTGSTSAATSHHPSASANSTDGTPTAAGSSATGAGAPVASPTSGESVASTESSDGSSAVGGLGLVTANPIAEGGGQQEQAQGQGGGQQGQGQGQQGQGQQGDDDPPKCIRDQVRFIYDELGRDSASSPPSTATTTTSEYDEDEEDEEGTDARSQIRYLPPNDFVRITKEVCQFPTFFNGPLYSRILKLWNDVVVCGGGDDGGGSGGNDDGDVEVVTYRMFRWYWKLEMEPYDAFERFFRLIKQPDAEYVVRDDFLPYIKELLKDHPGLEFLSNHAEFQEKYAITVITRIFYSVNRCHDGRITSRQIRRSDLLPAFQQVDEEEDINKVTRYFSYEHFYVLYCRFWELDHDRDYRITREDLLKYGDHCLSHMIVDRIFDAAPRPFAESGPWTGAGTAAAEGGGADGGGASTSDPQEGPSSPPLSPASADGSEATDKDKGQEQQSNKGGGGIDRDYLSYEDFIFFMLSEEDKANEISIRYWFGCIDVDGDGLLNNMEMRSFYAVQLHRMQCMGHEIVPFEDMLCQMIDMVKPANTDHLVPEDFLKPECAQVSGALFDALFNLNKYLLFEQRDPFMERQKREDEFDTDWDRFACIDYNRLAMEEEAREEEAMEIDWVTVDDEDDDGDEFNSMNLSSSEAPF